MLAPEIKASSSESPFALHDKAMLEGFSETLTDFTAIFAKYKESLYIEVIKLRSHYSKEREEIRQICLKKGEPQPRLDVYVDYRKKKGKNKKERETFEIQWRRYHGTRSEKTVFTTYIKKGKSNRYQDRTLITQAQTCEIELTLRFERRFALIRERIKIAGDLKKRIHDTNQALIHIPSKLQHLSEQYEIY